MLAHHDRSRCGAVTAHFSPALRRRLLVAVGLAAILATAWWCYHPGLSGDFLFDDFGNLPALGATGPVDNWPTFWRYITSGTADPTGRPLTLLTFLINARDWPAAPYPFKLTNVLLHLLNGALLCAVLLRLGKALDLQPMRARIAALFGAGAWLLHPLFVSTTLYIVQREAMLPATFVLIGILGWIAARDALAQGYARRGLVGMLLAAWGCTLLATLSKANGALFPLLLLLIEWIVLIPHRPMPSEVLERRRKRAVAVLLGLPIMLLALYLASGIPGALRSAPEVRGWTVGQRLLSEPRALCEYLALLFAPRVHSTGLFNDSFLVSRSLLDPASTLPCIVVVLGLMGIGFALRRRHPAIALALLFYFAAQLLESGWIPLELYYEHRNYLPAMLLFWPIGIGLGAPVALRALRGLCAIGIVAWLATLANQRAVLWGNGYEQALIWAAYNPASSRAQTSAALYDLARDRPRVAAARLQNALATHPRDLEISLNLVTAECRAHALRPQSLAIARDALRTTVAGGTVGFNWFNDALDLARPHACTGLDLAEVQSLLDAAGQNPYWQTSAGRRQDIEHVRGMLDLAQGRPDDALRAFDQALAANPKPDAALKQAAILGARGYPAAGLEHLDYWRTLAAPGHPGSGMARLHAWVLHHQHYWNGETAHLRATLATDAATRRGKTSTGKG